MSGQRSAHSTHRQAVVPPATGVRSSDIAYHQTLTRRPCAAKPSQVPILPDHPERYPPTAGPPHGPETPHAAHRRRTALAPQPAPACPEANVKIGPTEREDLSVELRGFEPLTPSMRTGHAGRQTCCRPTS